MAGVRAARGWRAGLVFVASAALIAASGCGGGGGDPTAAPAAASVQRSSPVPTASASPGSGNATLATLKPCELLSSADRSTAGLTSLGEEKAIGRTRACDWIEPGTFGLTISLDESAGLPGLKIDKRTSQQVTVGGHMALRVADRRGAEGSCAVLLAAGESANVQVDVSNRNFRDTSLACQRASTVAKLIEPRLP